MISPLVIRWCARLVRVAVLLVLGTTLAAQAAPMPNASRRVSITAREQPINAFLQDLFAAVDVPAVISPNLGGAVNGSFAGPADKVLRDVSRVYNLISYYDGSVMHVVPASDLVRRTFAEVELAPVDQRACHPSPSVSNRGRARRRTRPFHA